jgi:hypothetical protein
MSLVYEIIKDAFREANLIAITQSPTLDEQTEALRLLNRFISSVYGNEAGDKLQSLAVGTNNVVSAGPLSTYVINDTSYAPVNSRVIANLSEAATINLHPDPDDGARFSVIDASGNFATYNMTLNANGRKIEGSSSKLLNTNSTNKEWFYRADQSNWVLVSSLDLETSFPFPAEFEDMFVIGLAMRLNPRHGVEMDDQSLLSFRRQRSIFRARYSQTNEQNSELSLLRLSSNRLYPYETEFSTN